MMDIFKGRREIEMVERKKEILLSRSEEAVNVTDIITDIDGDEFMFDGVGGLSLSRIVHESEFLKLVVQELNNGFVRKCGIDEFEAVVDSKFLAAVTGINENVFSLLIKEADSDSIRSIVERTVGLVDFAQKALDYYGIDYFADPYTEGQPSLITEEGFYLYVLC
jgi:hypothetical protein